MELWQMAATIIITLAGVYTAVKTLTKPIKDKLDEIAKLDTRVRNLERWTDKQQIDLVDMSEKLTLTFDAVLALLDHAITTQNGNGNCHKAQDAMEAYVLNRLKRLNSYSNNKQ